MKLLNKLLLICFLAVLLPLPSPGSSTKTKIRSTLSSGHTYVYLQDVANYYGFCFSTTKERGTISNKYSRFVFNYDSRRGTFNGVQINYLYAPFLRGGQGFISEQDFRCLIDPLLRNKALYRHKMRLVVLDPGHGGNDKGASSWLYREKDLSLQLAKKIRTLLQKKGYTVLLTRESDFFISLEGRCAVANRKGADLFVSIHCNAAYDRSINGIETFTMPPAGAPSTASAKSDAGKALGNKYDKNNFRLAYEIHKSLVLKTGATDRGLKHARFYVLKNTSCPSVLVEAGFLSNSTEERSLGRKEYQDMIAQSIADGIVRYDKALK
ncbi:MAG: hypothetical protein A2X49_11690 [Lentisphaerae bacterium GWF2_52_8]|nr:MAG: hypothetical protein A2X49_11690 [Lentisphaerae bacterium GWF2_52_8]